MPVCMNEWKMHRGREEEGKDGRKLRVVNRVASAAMTGKTAMKAAGKIFFLLQKVN